MTRLELVPIYLAGRREPLRGLAEALARAFDADVRTRVPWFDPEQSFDPQRGQYRSTTLLRELCAAPGDGAERVLGVTTVDLFVPVLTYVFGEAELDGRAAVVSTHRLDPTVYGMPADERLLAARLRKEAVHELGHAFGLVHCAEPDCVMHGSTYVEEIDQKSDHFCESCARLTRGDDVLRVRSSLR